MLKCHQDHLFVTIEATPFFFQSKRVIRFGVYQRRLISVSKEFPCLLSETCDLSLALAACSRFSAASCQLSAVFFLFTTITSFLSDLWAAEADTAELSHHAEM